MKNLNRQFKYGAMVLFCFVLTPLVTYADDVDQRILELQKQIVELTKQAAVYQNNISQKQKEADTLSRQITLLNNQILKLQTQIVITGHQISTTKLQIGDRETKIFDTQANINQNKAAVSQLIAQIAQRDHLSLAAVLLKSPRLSDISNAAQADENLNRKLDDLLTRLKDERDQLQADKTALEGKKRNLENLNQQQVQQKTSADFTKNSKNTLLTQTKGKEAAYQKMLTDVETKREVFFEELKQLESQTIQSGNYIVHVTAGRVPARGTKLFKWPEENFHQTQNYGMTAYARRGAYGGAPHNGIDIANGYGTPIHAAAAGIILASGTNSGWGNWVAIRHDTLPAGGLVTLYSHLNVPTRLAAGTAVDTTSIIGFEGATGNVTGPHLHFSVYRDFFTYLNPNNGQLYFNYFEGSLNPLDYL